MPGFRRRSGGSALLAPDHGSGAAGEIPAGRDVRIAHPAGVLPIAAEVHDGRAERVVVYRTARRLMEGAVLVPERVLSDPEPFADRLASRPAVLAE